MLRVIICAALLVSGCAVDPPAPIIQTKIVKEYIKGTSVEDEKRAIVAASIYGYEITKHAPCPCPYSKDGACKGKSAWERKGGAEPRCYMTDVSSEDLARWRTLLKSAPAGPAQNP